MGRSKAHTHAQGGGGDGGGLSCVHIHSRIFYFCKLIFFSSHQLLLLLLSCSEQIDKSFFPSLFAIALRVRTRGCVNEHFLALYNHIRVGSWEEADTNYALFANTG